MEELIPFLRRAWSGEPFEYHGHRVRVTPRPVQQPLPIFLGGMSRAAIYRAARLADGFHTLMPQTWEMYRDACRVHDKPDPGPHTPRGPLFLWVTKDDKTKTLARLQPHFDHQVRSYDEQARASGQKVNPWQLHPDRPAPYRIVDPEEAIQLARSLGSNGELHFQPLLSAIDPALAWTMLRVLADDVLPFFEIALSPRFRVRRECSLPRPHIHVRPLRPRRNRSRRFRLRIAARTPCAPGIATLCAYSNA